MKKEINEMFLFFQLFIVYLFVYESYLKQAPLNLPFMVSVLVHCIGAFIEIHLLNAACFDAMQLYAIGGEMGSFNGSMWLSQYQKIVSFNSIMRQIGVQTNLFVFMQNSMFSLRVRGHPITITAHGLFRLDKTLTFSV